MVHLVKANKKWGQSGQAMIVIAFLAVAISLFTILGVTHFSASTNNLGSFLSQKRAFYAAEGALSTATIMIENYLAHNSTIDTPSLQNVLNGTPPQGSTPLASLMPSGYTLSTASVVLDFYTPDAPIPTGPFTGMRAPLTEVTLNVGVSTSGHVVGSVSTVLTIAEIFPFQFIVFSSLSNSGFYPANPLNLQGRMAINGDICLGTSSLLQVGAVVSSGAVRWGGDPLCPMTPPSPGNTMISSDSTFLNNTPPFIFVQLQANNDSGCVNCGGTPLAWPVYDGSTWSGNVQDIGNGVTPITFPGAASNGPTLPGYNGDSYTATSNAGLLRHAIDPVFPPESALSMKTKYAYKADIRIIDGVWYIQDPTNNLNWPGIPVWSDHPGAADDAYGNQVGQDDIRQRWNGTPNQWNASGPKDFSYYNYHDATKTIGVGSPPPPNFPPAVISYGALKQVTSATWNPGTLTLNGLGPNPLCFNHSNASCTTTGLSDALHQFCTCPSGDPAPNAPTFLLDGTRSGFVDTHYYNQGRDPNQGQILPANFDVSVLQTAVNDPGPGELGTYFGKTSFEGHVFNRIIFISYDWPGSATTFGASSGNNANFDQGSVSDPQQAGPFYPGLPPVVQAQQALPAPLCSNNGFIVHAGLAGQQFDTVAGPPATNHRFKIPDCASYSLSTIPSYPNAVRLYNASTFNTSLTIVSNLPVYIEGSYNSNSITASSSSSPWYPSLVAGDFVSVLSNNFDDAEDGWNINELLTAKPAMNTKVNTAIWSGYMRRTGSVAFEGLPGLIENWSAAQLLVTGSFVYGFYPVYRVTGIDPGAYTPPVNQYFNFDPHFSLSGKQPPGTSSFNVTAISTWSGN